MIVLLFNFVMINDLKFIIRYLIRFVLIFDKYEDVMRFKSVWFFILEVLYCCLYLIYCG